MAATVSRMTLDRYLTLVNRVVLTALSSARAQMATLTVAQLTPEVIKSILITTLKAADAAVSEVDLEFYRTLRKEVTGEDVDLELAMERMWDDDYIERAIDSMLDEQGNPYQIVNAEAFGQDLAQFMSRVINEGAKSHMIDYGDQDSHVEVRYARVPSGAETCAWCWALASRGFAYLSRESASHSHSNCDCVVVPSWGADELRVEGYDPLKYYDAYYDAKYDLESGNISDDLKRRIDERAANVPGYSKGWNGVLAVMRDKYGLK